MADTIQIKLENARTIQDLLNAFEKKVAKKIVRKGIKAAWHPLLVKSKANARALDTGRSKKKKSQRIGHKIAKVLVLKSFKKQKTGQYGMHVRIDPKNMPPEFIQVSKRTGNRNFIPVAIEYGHAFPGRGGKGAPKDVAARPFMRKALDASLPKALKIFEQYLEKAIAEENAKR